MRSNKAKQSLPARKEVVLIKSSSSSLLFGIRIHVLLQSSGIGRMMYTKIMTRAASTAGLGVRGREGREAERERVCVRDRRIERGAESERERSGESCSIVSLLIIEIYTLR